VAVSVLRNVNTDGNSLGDSYGSRAVLLSRDRGVLRNIDTNGHGLASGLRGLVVLGSNRGVLRNVNTNSDGGLGLTGLVACGLLRGRSVLRNIDASGDGGGVGGVAGGQVGRVDLGGTIVADLSRARNPLVGGDNSGRGLVGFAAGRVALRRGGSRAASGVGWIAAARDGGGAAIVGDRAAASWVDWVGRN
jgi:hypothetical protein